MSPIPNGSWSVDPDRSSVGFSIRHMLFTKVRGTFGFFSGVLEVTGEGGRGQGRVDAASIDTGERIRDEHLRGSGDFFDVARYPEITFESGRIEVLGDHGGLRLTGELTMRGVKREIHLEGELEHPTHDEDGADRISLALSGQLRRADFGLVWNQALETGGALLGDKVEIAISISAVRDAHGGRLP